MAESGRVATAAEARSLAGQDTAMNVFDDDIGAAVYEAARPSFHPSVVQRVAEVLRGRRLQLALDVACGTGQSTAALAAISDAVVGLDASEAMLRHRRQARSIQYVRAEAEHLPIRSGTIDLVSVGLAIHWFDSGIFLREAHRVLQRACWLLVYDSGFCGRMRGHSMYGEWVSSYRQRFPGPPRSPHPPDSGSLAEGGFHHVLSDNFVHAETYNVDQLVSYLMTQSNVLFAVREGRDTRAGALEYLRATLAPIFRGGTGVFEFDGWLRVYQRAG